MITSLIPPCCPTLHLQAGSTCSIHHIAESPLRPWKSLTNSEEESKPYSYLDHALHQIEPVDSEGWLRILAPNSAAEHRLRSEFDQLLDPGEASCLALAISRRMTLVTDDLAARRLAEKREVPLSGTLGILIALVRHNAFSLKEANAMLEAMIQRRYRSPVDRLDEFI